MTMTMASKRARRQQPAVELVGITEAAELIGVSRTRFHQLEQRREFPPPLATLACGRIWLRESIELWAIKYPRVAGRPVLHNRRADDTSHNGNGKKNGNGKRR